eukprot:SAG31_NODE_4913_length_2871_cov_2.230159_4_plen_159_part_00
MQQCTRCNTLFFSERHVLASQLSRLFEKSTTTNQRALHSESTSVNHGPQLLSRQSINTADHRGIVHECGQLRRQKQPKVIPSQQPTRSDAIHDECAAVRRVPKNASMPPIPRDIAALVSRSHTSRMPSLPRRKDDQKKRKHQVQAQKHEPSGNRRKFY